MEWGDVYNQIKDHLNRADGILGALPTCQEAPNGGHVRTEIHVAEGRVYRELVEARRLFDQLPSLIEDAIEEAVDDSHRDD